MYKLILPLFCSGENASQHWIMDGHLLVMYTQKKKNGVYIHNYGIRPYLLNNIIWPEHYVIGLLLLIDEDFGEFYKTKDQW